MLKHWWFCNMFSMAKKDRLKDVAQAPAEIAGTTQQ